jgi:hypothetical protein
VSAIIDSQSSQDPQRSATVDVSAVADCRDAHNVSLIIDGVHDPVSPTRIRHRPCEPVSIFAPGWAGVISQGFRGGLDPLSDLPVKLAERPQRGRPER